jgi:hypothetical protein
MDDADRGIDMAEHSGGHYFDTGDGPMPVVAPTGLALESESQTAYRAYLDHRPACPRCQQSTFTCDEAAVLWATYKDTLA